MTKFSWEKVDVICIALKGKKLPRLEAAFYKRNFIFVLSRLVIAHPLLWLRQDFLVCLQFET